MAALPSPSWALPPPHRLAALARSWLDEDSPTSDLSSALIGPSPTRAQILAKSPGVLAGAPLAEAVFGVTGCRVDWLLGEGSRLPGGRVMVAEVSGPGDSLLLGERVALNCLARCSGVATAASEAVGVATRACWKGVVAGTRKTTPGFRAAEKYALAVGGAQPHREGLGGLLMLKDNHLAAAPGGLQELVGEGLRVGGFTRLLEVECGSLAEAEAAAASGASIVLLDNFTPQAARAAAAALKVAHPRLTVEVSGGITLETLPQFLAPQVDVVSMGCLTHSAPALDFALKVLPHNRGGEGETS